MLNENRSSLGAARCTRIHSPVRTWTPVFGSESRADAPPTCQYRRTSGKTEARDASDGVHRNNTSMTTIRTAWLFAPVVTICLRPNLLIHEVGILGNRLARPLRIALVIAEIWMRADVWHIWRPTILEPMSAAIRTIVLALLRFALQHT